MARESQYLKQRRARRLSRLFSWSLFLLGLGGLGYFSLFSSYFQIQEIKVEIEFPEKSVVQDYLWQLIRQQHFGFIPAENIFFNSKKNLLAKLAEAFPELEKLEWHYNLINHTLKISGQLREPAIKVCQSEECFLVDFNGVAFKPSDSSRLEKAFLLLENRSSDKIEPGKVFLPPKMIKFAYEFKNLLKDYLELDHAVLEEEFLKAKFFKLLTTKGWFLLVSFELDPYQIAENLKLIIEKELKGDLTRLEYLDLRYPNKAYYKLR